MKRLESLGENLLTGRKNDDFSSDLQMIFESGIVRLPKLPARD